MAQPYSVSLKAYIDCNYLIPYFFQVRVCARCDSDLDQRTLDNAHQEKVLASSWEHNVAEHCLEARAFSAVNRRERITFKTCTFCRLQVQLLATVSRTPSKVDYKGNALVGGALVGFGFKITSSSKIMIAYPTRSPTAHKD